MDECNEVILVETKVPPPLLDRSRVRHRDFYLRFGTRLHPAAAPQAQNVRDSNALDLDGLPYLEAH
jgi:hypothetical protein